MNSRGVERAFFILAAVVILAVAFSQLGIARGRELERRRAKQSTAAVGRPLASPMRCHQEIVYDAAHQPQVVPHPWTPIEADSHYRMAQSYHRTAEGAGLWTDRGRRAFQVAVLAYLEILTCWPPDTPGAVLR